MDALNKRLGESLNDSANKTAASIAGIGERLTVIDEAQKNITALSGQVVSLAGGSFQQAVARRVRPGPDGRHRARSACRQSLYEFQATLSNGNRPDCIIRIPECDRRCMVIDSKFPLEGFTALRQAADDDERKTALARVRADVAKHVNDIAEKYLIPGEVQTPAIMFVPSESIYAELHDGFQRRDPEGAPRPRDGGVAQHPDAGDQHHPDRDEGCANARTGRPDPQEVGALLSDVQRLGDRVRKLQRHFNQADADMKDILFSTAQDHGAGEQIEKVELAPLTGCVPKARLSGPASKTWACGQ